MAKPKTLLLWHTLPIENVLERQKTDRDKGLNLNEVQSRLLDTGKNELPRGHRPMGIILFLNQLSSPLIYILLIAAALTWYLGHHTDTWAILLVVGINATIGYYQEFRANRIFESLKRLVKIRAVVVREGDTHVIDATDLVPGDIVLLKSGSKIPADIRLLRAENLKINEAALTGEWMATKKSTSIVKPKKSLADRHNMAYMGTFMEEGEGQGVVVATGADTEIGKISILTEEVGEEQSPTQLRITQLAKFLGKVALGAGTLILLTGLYFGHGFSDIITTSIAVAVAVVPEGLPASISVILAVASQRILRNNGLIKRLVAAETLVSTTVICTDKTGTLTYGEMKVEEIISENEEKTERIITAMAMANEAVVEFHEGVPKISGDPTDKAKMDYFLSKGGNLNQLQKSLPRRSLMPFDTGLNIIASFHQDEDKIHVFAAGAPESILKFSQVKTRQINQIREQYEKFAHKGYRVIAMAEHSFHEGVKKINWENQDQKLLVKNLTFLGIVALRDGVRSDALKTLRDTRRAGIKIIMITGDHLLTAKTIGQELGFSTAHNAVLTGEDLDGISDAELSKRIENIEIISRASPLHKMRIIKAWKKNKAVVAMTGDGINDAPALKLADIGVALGSGTDVAKESADLILLNDSFRTITAAVRQGRIGFDNIKKVTTLLISNMFAEVILISTALIMRVPFPITATQILWANMVQGSLSGISLGLEPGEKGIMKQKPVGLKAPILNKMNKTVVFFVGILVDIVLFSVFWYLLHNTGWPLAKIQTFIFAALCINTLYYAFAFKSLRQPIWQIDLLNNRYLLGGVTLSFFILLLSIYTPFLNTLLGTYPLSFINILAVLGFGLIKLSLVEMVKWWYRVRTTN